jgi:hypothetical protein
MPQSEARAWWADVQDVRETIERRRAAEQAAQAPAVARRAGGGTADQREQPRSRPAQAHHAATRPARPARRGAAARRPHGAPRRPLHLPSHPPPAGDRRVVEISGRAVSAPRVPAAHAAHAVAPVDASERAIGLRGSRRRPSPSPSERLAHRPDRIAAWAAVLGLALMVVAAL